MKKMHQTAVVFAALALAGPIAAHEGHEEAPNEFLHAVMHGVVDLAPIAALIVIGFFVARRFGVKSDRTDRE